MSNKHDQAFWDELANVVAQCQLADDPSRDRAWRRLADLMHPWCCALAHRKGVGDEQGKLDYASFFLSWLAQPGRLASFDATRGTLHSWLNAALDMCYADYWRQERNLLARQHQDVNDYAEALPARQGDLESEVVEARDELTRIPTSLRVAFLSIHHSVFGPLDAPEQTTFMRLFGVPYDTVRHRLDGCTLREVAALLGKTDEWAYQVRSRVLKRLRNLREDG